MASEAGAEPVPAGVTAGGGSCVAVPLSLKAVLRDGSGRLLVCRNHRGEWELPGGRPEAGESDARTVAREVAEETGLDVRVGALLGAASLATPSGWVAILAYACASVDADPVLRVSSEHASLAFRADADLTGADFPDAYRRLAALAPARPQL